MLIEGNNPGGMLFAVDNSNSTGVAGANPGAPDANAATATSGLELAIPIDYIGAAAGQTLGVQALLNSTWSSSNQRHPPGISNQSLPAFPEFTSSINTGFVVDFRSYAGDQFAMVSLVPEPGSIALLIVAVAALAATHRFGGRG
jgi:hypothetical protein